MKETLSANQQIKLVDYEYKKLLRYLCRQIINKFPGVPLEPDDLYYEFLFYIPSVFKEFDENKSSFKTFLVWSLKNFANKKCRSWMKKNHLVMNFSQSIDDSLKEPSIEPSLPNFKLDTSILNVHEKIFYIYHYEKNMSKNKVIKKMDINNHKFNKLSEIVKTKLYNHNIKKISII